MTRRSAAWRVFALALMAAIQAAGAGAQEIQRGEVAVGELNCVACHRAGSLAEGRLGLPGSPVLGEKGRRLTPQWLRAFLSDPQATKPGTTMPDLLHGLSPAENTETAEALTHYLLSLQRAEPNDPGDEYDPAAVANGRTLYHTVGCVACHAAQDPPKGHGPDAVAGPPVGTVLWGDLTRKTSVSSLAAFLEDPLATWQAGRMPSLNLKNAESTAIAMYLLREQRTDGDATTVPGLRYEYYEVALEHLPRFERLHAKTKGIARRIGLYVRERDDNFALRFTGNIAISVAGEYTFSVVSDDGARLLIDGKEVLANDGLHDATEGKGSVVLTPGEHALTLLYFNGTGGRALDAYWQGPTFARREIPVEVLSHTEERIRPLGTDPAFAVDAVKAERGKELFVSLNCASCHAGISGQHGRPAKPMAELGAGAAGACIDEHAGKDRPQFTMTDHTRDDIRALLTASVELDRPLLPAARIERTLTALQCYACHDRDGHGGPSDARRAYFTSTGNADLGDEGRFPPTLTGVGAKLKSSALDAVLWQGAVARPYMATRMPQFGLANVEALARAFEQADDPKKGKPAEVEPAVASDAAAFGRKLAGTGGLACIACHNFAGHPALGVPALDMTLMFDRLKFAWFRRYLLDPQTLRPGTRMPAFWPEGHASNREIFDGNTDQQIAALRTYLALGKSAPFPDGLIPAKAELVPRTEAIIYRNFIQGAGPRGIGVGYPEKVNLAFDAQEDRIALIWQGAFIDASRHRTGRAQGYEPPLGVNVVSWTPGAPFARLPSADAPWPKETGRAAGYQFRGYRLEGDERRPTFLYDFAGGRVNDTPMGRRIPGAADAGLRRTLVISPPADGKSSPDDLYYYRAAVGDRIESVAPGVYLVDKKVTLQVAGGGTALLRDQGEKTELLVPFSTSGGEVKLEETLTW